jgi:beta-glucosidase
VQVSAIQDIITGRFEPSALLPLQMPADMETVEANFEDTPMDMTPYVDNQGNSYDFGFGLNWSGVIKDDRNAIYQRDKW